MQVPENRPWFKFWPERMPRHIDYPRIPLFHFLMESARTHPDNIAFQMDRGKYSYKEFDLMTAKLAAGLRGLGIKKGDRIMLLLPNCLEFPVAYYGILKSGAIVVPTNPMYKDRELAHHLNDSGSTAVITEMECFDALKHIQHETGLSTIIVTGDSVPDGAVSFNKLRSENAPYKPDFSLNPDEDIAAIEYTGGTTGLPKGVLLSHYNLTANAIQNATWMGWKDTDVVAGVLPLYHSWGASLLNSAIYSSAKVIVFERYDLETLLEAIQADKITILYGAASMFIMMVSNPKLKEYNLSSLRWAKPGAMPIPPDVKEKWESATGSKMMLGYGLSEASPETHNNPPQRIKAGTIGIPMMDVDARIVDADDGVTELPPDKVGELVIRGPQVMQGYLNRPEDNKETLKNGWLHTGDLARMDKDGYFSIADRKKEIIKYKGYTIAPAEVEAVVYEHPAVKECAVVGKPDPLAGEIPTAFVVLKQGRTATAPELIEFCKKRLSAYKRIREVVFVDEIPKTTVGKVLRRVLRDRLLAEQS